MKHKSQLKNQLTIHVLFGKPKIIVEQREYYITFNVIALKLVHWHQLNVLHYFNDISGVKKALF